MVEGDCWMWPRGKSKDGYGQIKIGGRMWMVHRVIYEGMVGPIPEGLMLDHLCHVRNCVNPAHLRLATHKQNAENRQGAQRNSKSGVRGVSWHKHGGKWRGQVKHHGKTICLGYFTDLAEAERAVIAKHEELFTPLTQVREGVPLWPWVAQAQE